MIAELFLAAIGGAGTALGIAAYLSRAFLKLQSEKILARHAQALAIEKESLAHNLAIEFHQKSIGITRREQDRVEALKSLYAAIVELNAAIIRLRSHARINRQKEFKAAYFDSLAAIFNDLSSTFTQIADVHKTIELKAIYLEDNTEQRIRQMLSTIQNHYDQVLADCNAILSKAKSIGDSLSEATQPRELDNFCLEIISKWNLIIEPSKANLKNAVRESLLA